MSWLKGDKVTAEDFIALKEKVKTELARRSYTGSVKQYATDYTDMPTLKKKIKTSHILEIVDTANKINDIDYDLSEPIVIRSLESIDNFIQDLSEIDVHVQTLAETGCKQSCTGLCLNSCYDACRGCSGECSSTCVNKCGGTCQGACYDGCGVCSRSCSGNCKSTCTAVCTKQTRSGQQS